MRPLIPAVLLFVTSACVLVSDDDVSSRRDSLDEDDDGAWAEGQPWGTDCDDSDPAIGPDAEELCDGVDNNCDGEIDEGLTVEGWLDVDDDGYGDAARPETACIGAAGIADNALDCDDADTSVGPDAFFLDGDGDGFGRADVRGGGCDGAAGYTEVGTDCNDADAAVFPGADERCNGVDDDCDMLADDDDDDVVDDTIWYQDGDQDGFGIVTTSARSCQSPPLHSAVSGDCDDSDNDVFPGAEELCDAEDNDCDGAVDETAPTWFEDLDGDGYGFDLISVVECDPGPGWASRAGDCDDQEAAIHPAADEHCGFPDDNCDGDLDAGAVDPGTWYLDGDADGVGGAVTATSCAAPAGHVAGSGDCDDADATVFPGAEELCDGVDNDCEGDIDEEAPTWYLDGDGDGFGTASTTAVQCDAPGAGWVSVPTDCDDGAAAVHPGASETCDDMDEDCDGEVDEDATDPTTWFVDGDGDGYGIGAGLDACDAPAGFVDNADDCDDSRDFVSPGDVEVCTNGLDDDCDPGTDASCDLPAVIDAVDADAVYTGQDLGPADLAGGTLASGDFDGDGFSDVLVGARQANISSFPNAGAVYLMYGPTLGAVSLFDYDARFTGETTGEFVGYDMEACDLNGDGRDDLLLGAPEAALEKGYGAIVYATSTRWSGSLPLSSVEGQRWIGGHPSDRAGVEVGCGGDFFGTGFPDLAIASYKDDNASGTDAGQVVVLKGTSAGFPTGAGVGTATLAYIGAPGQEFLGLWMEMDGDVSADGLVDLAIGDGGYFTKGTVSVVFGHEVTGTFPIDIARDASITYTGAGQGFSPMSYVGDMDEDGVDDLAVGAWDYAGSGDGAVLVYSGASLVGALDASAADWILTGGTADAVGFQRSVSTAGDVNGDGTPDMIVGALGNDGERGAAYVIYGPMGSGTESVAGAAASAVLGTTAGDQLGNAVAGAGDTNGDGYDDLLIGAALQNGSAGMAYLVLGLGI